MVMCYININNADCFFQHYYTEYFLTQPKQDIVFANNCIKVSNILDRPTYTLTSSLSELVIKRVGEDKYSAGIN